MKLEIPCIRISNSLLHYLYIKYFRLGRVMALVGILNTIHTWKCISCWRKLIY